MSSRLRVLSFQKEAAAPKKAKAAKSVAAPKKATTIKASAKPRVVSATSKKSKVLKITNGTDMDVDDEDATHRDDGSDVEMAKTKAPPKKTKTVTEQYQKVSLILSFLTISNVSQSSRKSGISSSDPTPISGV